jgi:dTDP-glucose 4,6-dehydratase
LTTFQHLRRAALHSFKEWDICQPFGAAGFDPGPVDYVFNLASPASPPEYLRLAIETLRVGSIGTSRTPSKSPPNTQPAFCKPPRRSAMATRCSIRRSEEYWGNVNPVGPRSVYDESKRYAEALVMAYHRYRGVNTHLVRIFNTYGPRLHPSDGRVISNFMMQALRGEPLTIYGSGNQTRSFCYVDDLIEGIVRLSRSERALSPSTSATRSNSPSSSAPRPCLKSPAQRATLFLGAWEASVRVPSSIKQTQM